MSATVEQPASRAPAPDAPEPSPGRAAAREIWTNPALVWKYIGLPVLVVVAITTLWFYVNAQELDSIEQRWLNEPVIRRALVRHIWLTGVATLFVVAIAVPLGIALTRPIFRRFTPVFIGVANTGQAIPSIGLIALLAVLVGIGPRTAIIAIVAYCILPVLRNTMVGLDQVDQSLIEAGRGMGMTKGAVLFRIELPLSVPIVLAGVRTALILVVGTMTLATFINAGGLGDIINGGIVNRRDPVLITGSVLAISLALLIDWLGGLAEDFLRPRGL